MATNVISTAPSAAKLAANLYTLRTRTAAKGRDQLIVLTTGDLFALAGGR